MDCKNYAMKLEKKLIDEFKENFFEKVGYYPTVLTRVQIDGDVYVPVLPLSRLKDYFDPFLPEPFGFKLMLDARSRVRELVELRNIYCHIARLMGYSFSTIAKSLGKDHTTIIHNVESFRDLLDTDDAFRQKYSTILSHIKQQYESSVMANIDQVQHESEPAVLSGLLPVQDQAHQHHQC